MILNKQELLLVTGGAITASLLNALARGITTIVDLGRALGTAIRRIASDHICSL